jgi:hypothetical protein
MSDIALDAVAGGGSSAHVTEPPELEPELEVDPELLPELEPLLDVEPELLPELEPLLDVEPELLPELEPELLPPGPPSSSAMSPPLHEATRHADAASVEATTSPRRSETLVPIVRPSRKALSVTRARAEARPIEGRGVSQPGAPLSAR